MTNIEVIVISEPKTDHVLSIQKILKTLSRTPDIKLNSFVLCVRGPKAKQFLSLIQTYHLNFSVQGNAQCKFKIAITS